MRHPLVIWMEIGGDFDLTSMKLHEVQATIIWGLFFGGEPFWGGLWLFLMVFNLLWILIRRPCGCHD